MRCGGTGCRFAPKRLLPLVFNSSVDHAAVPDAHDEERTVREVHPVDDPVRFMGTNAEVISVTMQLGCVRRKGILGEFLNVENRSLSHLLRQICEVAFPCRGEADAPNPV